MQSKHFFGFWLMEVDFLVELIWMFPKIGGKPTKMDGENNGKPYEQMDDLGVPLFLETPISLLMVQKSENNLPTFWDVFPSLKRTFGT